MSNTQGHDLFGIQNYLNANEQQFIKLGGAKKSRKPNLPKILVPNLVIIGSRKS